jgi:transposase InsO family protein
LASFNEASGDFAYILIVVDYFTGFCWIRPLPNKLGKTIALALWEICRDFGLPKIIQSDNGTEFLNSVIEALMALMHVEHRLVTKYYPQANGRCERQVRTVLTSIKKLLSGCVRDWALYCPQVQLLCNLRISQTTKTSPFTLMFGRPFSGFSDFQNMELQHIPPDILHARFEQICSLVYPTIRSTTSRLNTSRQHYVDITRKLISSPLPIGTPVMLLNRHKATKADQPYVGPYTIVRRTRGGAYTLRLPDGELLPRDVSPNQLKILHDMITPDPEQRFNVNAIIAHRGEGVTRQYLTSWKGYDEKENTWEPASSFDELTPIITYWKKIGKLEQ